MKILIPGIQRKRMNGEVLFPLISVKGVYYITEMENEIKKCRNFAFIIFVEELNPPIYKKHPISHETLRFMYKCRVPGVGFIILNKI